MKNHHKYLLILFFLVMLLFSWGCATSNVISIHYEPHGKPSFTIPPDKSLNLQLGPIRGMDSGIWYRIANHSWTLEKPRELIVYDALAEELRRMHITVAENPLHGKSQQGRIEVEIRWFEPYGCYPLSAAVILSLSLYQKNAQEPSWRGKFQAGTFYRAAFLTDYLKKVLMQKAASEALYKTVRQLSWNWDFIRAIDALAIDNDSIGADITGMNHETMSRDQS
jgi:hypothetical protein